MNIQTAYFGVITIEEANVYHFINGLPGFEDEKNFVLLPIEENSSFKVLQSTNNSALAFIVTNPYTFVKEYSFDLNESTVEALDLKKEEEALVLSIVSLKEPFEKSTINLKAPIIINQSNKRGKQSILDQHEYSLRHAIASTEGMR